MSFAACLTGSKEFHGFLSEKELRTRVKRERIEPTDVQFTVSYKKKHHTMENGGTNISSHDDDDDDDEINPIHTTSATFGKKT